MISLAKHLKHLEKFTVNNSPVLLTAVGVVGVIGTAVLTHKAAVTADRRIARINEKRLITGEDLMQPKEMLKTTWKLYTPPVLAGTATIAAVVMSNRISTKRAAALATACMASERAFAEYKEKVLEHVGENKERKVRDEIAQDKVLGNPPSEASIIIAGGGEVVCHDQYSGRYFRSNIENIKRAVNEINHAINTKGSATLSDFYAQIGLDTITESDELGWDVDKLMDVHFHPVLTEEGESVVSFAFESKPARYRFPNP